MFKPIWCNFATRLFFSCHYRIKDSGFQQQLKPWDKEKHYKAFYSRAKVFWNWFKKLQYCNILVASKQIILFSEMLKFSKIFFSKRIFLWRKMKISWNVLKYMFCKMEYSNFIYLINMCQSRQGTMVSMKRFLPHPSPQRFARQIGAFHYCLQLARGHSLPEID